MQQLDVMFDQKKLFDMGKFYDYFLIMAVQILILQVFFSSYIFKANVMVQVATQQAANPVSSLRVENSTLLFWPVQHSVIPCPKYD